MLYKITVPIILFFVSVLVGVDLVKGRNSPQETYTGEVFNVRSIDLPSYELYDLGVADINSDDFYDIYTVNHSARQSILINDQHGEFQERIDELGLSQDPVFPNLENRNIKPVMDKAGLYIYRVNKYLHIKSLNLESAVTGTLSLPWPLVVKKAKDSKFTFSVSSTYEKTIENTQLDFIIEDGGELIVSGEEDILELPHLFELGSSVRLDKVFIGHSAIDLTSHKFILEWRDRHAMSWADVNGDGDLDVFISRGGVKGQLDAVPTIIGDRLMISNGVKLLDSTQDLALQKGYCPARQAAWVDHDNDGLLDIYISCGRGQLSIFNNLLLKQIEPGVFEDMAVVTGLDFGRISVFRWVDFDADGDLDLLSVDDNELVYYENIQNKYKKVVLIKDLTTDFVQLQVADFDNDGDFDGYMVSRSESMLITNNNGELKVVDPDTYGLPRGGRSAQWVDVNNDGLIDLHTVPDGIYLQESSGRFNKTGLLDTGENILKISQSRCSWFDLENDGDQDAICAIQRNNSKEVRIAKKLIDKTSNTQYWNFNLYSNFMSENNWLQVDLNGTTWNKQGIGSIVEVVTGPKTQIRAIGADDGAHYSQGNFRASFGLGAFDTVDLLRVHWTDGSTTELENIIANKVIEVVK